MSNCSPIDKDWYIDFQEEGEERQYFLHMSLIFIAIFKILNLMIVTLY